MGQVLRTDTDTSRGESNAAQSASGDLLFEEATRAPYTVGSLPKSKGGAFNDVLMYCVNHIPTQLRPETNEKNWGRKRTSSALFFWRSTWLAFHPVRDAILFESISHAFTIRLLLIGKPAHASCAFGQRQLP